MRNPVIIAVITVVVVIVVGVGYTLFRPPAPASEPIQTIPLDPNATLQTNTQEEPTPVAQAPTEETEPTAEATEVTTDEPTAEPQATEAEATAEPEPTETVAPTEAPPAEPTVFEIDQNASEVSFTINEVLRGDPTTVVGTSNQVSGQIAVNPADLSQTQVGTIQINARTFTTPEPQRNRALNNFILQTDQFEFITFVPTSIDGLPTSAAVGDSFTFQLSGDLTIKDQTRPVTFDVTATAPSDGQLTGTATGTITYSEWGITIPDVPFVADIDSELLLKLDFVANAVS